MVFIMESSPQGVFRTTVIEVAQSPSRSLSNVSMGILEGGDEGLDGTPMRGMVFTPHVTQGLGRRCTYLRIFVVEQRHERIHSFSRTNLPEGFGYMRSHLWIGIG